MGERHDTKATGLTKNKRVMAVWLLLPAVGAGVAACLVADSPGAHLELAPVFVGVALAVVTVRTYRSRSRRGRG
jgi:Flp pilus assembly protein TadB